MTRYLTVLLALMLLASCGNDESSSGGIKPVQGGVAPSASKATVNDDVITDIGKYFTVDSNGARPGVWTSDVEAAFKLAQEKQLPMLQLYVGSDWSYASSCLIRNVLSKPEWQSFIKDGYVMVYMDFPRRDQRMTEAVRQRNEKIRIQNKVSDYPSMLFCDANATPIANLRVNAIITTDELVRSIRLCRRGLPQEQEALVRRTGKTELIQAYQKVKECQKEREELLAKARKRFYELEDEIQKNNEMLAQGVIAWEISLKSPADQAAYKTLNERLAAAQAELQKIKSGNLQMTVKTSEVIENCQKVISECQHGIDDILLKEDSLKP